MLTDEEINREISEFTGESKLVGLMRRGFWYRPNGHGYTSIESEAWRLTPEEAKRHENLRDDQPVIIEKFSPRNYTDDLNACHCFEKEIVKDADTGYKYDMFLCQVANLIDPQTGLPIFMNLWHATARQRCEALLRTINKWKD